MVRNIKHTNTHRKRKNNQKNLWVLGKFLPIPYMKVSVYFRTKLPVLLRITGELLPIPSFYMNFTFVGIDKKKLKVPFSDEKVMH